MFSFDFLITDDYKVYLGEINNSPGFGFDNPNSRSFYEYVFEFLFNLIYYDK